MHWAIVGWSNEKVCGIHCKQASFSQCIIRQSNYFKCMWKVISNLLGYVKTYLNLLFSQKRIKLVVSWLSIQCKCITVTLYKCWSVASAMTSLGSCFYPIPREVWWVTTLMSCSTQELVSIQMYSNIYLPNCMHWDQRDFNYNWV